MKYISTRGGELPQGFKNVVLKGLAKDGGLFVPEVWPKMPVSFFEELRSKSYVDVALEVFKLFVGRDIEEGTLKKLLKEAYGTFSHKDVAPLKKLKDDLYILELFHGPTLAFKDVALQILARLMEHFLKEEGGNVTVFAATSGDTGAAAVEALQNRNCIDAFVLHPKGRISEMQRRQMTTCLAPNIHNIAIEGTFDDCQKLLKSLLGDKEIQSHLNPTTINSINWARVLAQVVYYIYSGLKIGGLEKPVNFVVPSGNFGNAFAGLVAHKMGFPINRLIVATNENDILARAFNEGVYSQGVVKETPSPAMDIQVSSNFERHLFDSVGRNDVLLNEAVELILNKKDLFLEGANFIEESEIINSESVTNKETLKMIKSIWEEFGEIIDPHTAVGFEAEKRNKGLEGPKVVLSTAHPSKFPETVIEAIGETPETPPSLAGILDKTEQYDTLSGNYAELKKYIIKASSS